MHVSASSLQAACQLCCAELVIGPTCMPVATPLVTAAPAAAACLVLAILQAARQQQYQQRKVGMLGLQGRCQQARQSSSISCLCPCGSTLSLTSLFMLHNTA